MERRRWKTNVTTAVAAIAFAIVTGFAMLADYATATFIFGGLTVLFGFDAVEEEKKE